MDLISASLGGLVPADTLAGLAELARGTALRPVTFAMALPTDLLLARRDLSPGDVRDAVGALLDDAVPAPDKAVFLRALADKGETPAEIAALVEAFLERAVDPGLDPASCSGPLVDVCGTGGDRLHLFNVSTTAMFVIAAAGATVVKHGNRGITSKSGGADVLEALGVRIDLPPADFRECVARSGIGFLFAPNYHPTFRAVAPVRQLLAQEGRRTVFNLLGPLLNPARPAFQLVGVFGPEWPPVFADILGRLGREAAWAVHGTTADGASMDELSVLGPSLISQWRRGSGSSRVRVLPAELGLPPAKLEDLRGGDATENALILRGILEGQDHSCRRDMVVLNAGAALAVAGLASNLPEGMALAAERIDDGSAFARLNAFRLASNA